LILKLFPPIVRGFNEWTPPVANLYKLFICSERIMAKPAIERLEAGSYPSSRREEADQRDISENPPPNVGGDEKIIFTDVC